MKCIATLALLLFLSYAIPDARGAKPPKMTTVVVKMPFRMEVQYPKKVSYEDVEIRVLLPKGVFPGEISIENKTTEIVSSQVWGVPSCLVLAYQKKALPHRIFATLSRKPFRPTCAQSY